MLAIVLALGCDGGECVFDSDCELGNHCASGACTSECTTDEECTATMGPAARCTTFGRCAMPFVPDGGAACVASGGADEDIDGHCSLASGGDDCDDTAATVHPGATERCERAVDDDCDGAVDEMCGWFFGRPHVVLNVHTASDASHVGPQLSADARELTFASNPDGATYGIHRARRGSASEPFGAASTEAVGASGESVEWASFRSDGLEVVYQVADSVLRASRDSTSDAFGTPEPVVADARQPFLSSSGRELYFEQTVPSPSRIARAVRASSDVPFDPPSEVTLEGDTVRDFAPSLTPDERTLLFVRELPAGHARVYAAERTARSEPFGAPVELSDLALPSATVLGVAFSPDTRELFFASGGAWAPSPIAIWRAEVCRDAPCETRIVACAEGLRSSDGLHCYRAFPTPAAWDIAQGRCVDRGGHLVTLHSLAEYSTVRALTGATNHWLGGSDAALEGSWEWVTGEPWLVQFWAGGEPNNVGGAEHCLAGPCATALCTGDATWNDLSCSSAAPYVCETELWPTW